MPRNFIIGIGGTGARCVEALLHLCAAGLGPEDLWVGLIDQDSNNGNLTDVKDVLQWLGALNGQLHDTDDQARRLPLLRTRLWAGATEASRIDGNTPYHWRPAPLDTDTFEKMFSYGPNEPESQALMQALYHRGPQGMRAELSEHRMELKKGFHGRPGLGAAVLLNKAQTPDDPFWQALQTCVRPAAGDVGPEPIRVMLVGSVFGGTGAGGLPILARFLRQMARDEANRWRMRLSAIVMGPYFRYTQPDPGKSLSADPDNFPAKLRDAFQYYATLLEADPFLDRIYLAGWRNLIDFHGDAGVDRAGGPEQRNPASLPELYAGLAAKHFFDDEESAFPDIHDPKRRCSVFATSIRGEELPDEQDPRRKEWALTWTDLPGDNQTLRRALGQHIRFCHVYHYFFHNTLADDRQRGSISRERWYRRLARTAMEETRIKDPKEALRNLDRYAERALIWWGGIDEMTGPGDLPHALIDSGAFARSEVINNYTQVVLKQNVEDTDSWRRFTHMVKGEEAHALALDEVFRALNNARPPTNAQGIGRFVGALYEACDA